MREFLKFALAMGLLLAVVLTVRLMIFAPGVFESLVKSEASADTKSASTRCAVRQVKMPCFFQDARG